MSPHDIWDTLYWRAYEWAHNKHHPSASRLNHFATSFADKNQDKRSPDGFTDFWERWERGEIPSNHH